MAIYMIIEHFPPNPSPVYERFRTKGRLAPDGLHYINSWVTKDMSKCYQIMECENKALLNEWMSAWEDLVRLDVEEVVTSHSAAARFNKESEKTSGRG